MTAQQDSASVTRVTWGMIASVANATLHVINPPGLGVMLKQVHASVRANGRGNNATRECALGHPSVVDPSMECAISGRGNASALVASGARIACRCDAIHHVRRTDSAHLRGNACASMDFLDQLALRRSVHGIAVVVELAT